MHEKDVSRKFQTFKCLLIEKAITEIINVMLNISVLVYHINVVLFDIYFFNDGKGCKYLIA